MDNNNNNNQNENANQNENQNEMKNLEKKVDIQNKVIQDNQKEIEKKEKEIEDKNKDIEDLRKTIAEMKPVFEEFIKKMEIKEKFPQFSNSKIIKDIKYIKKLQEWINDNDFFYKMKKGFSAKRDGFDSKKWHEAVDGKIRTLVIIKTTDNFIFGGFTRVGWNSEFNNYRRDSQAFIFSLRNGKEHRTPQKFTIKEGEEKYAIYYNLVRGPWFGKGENNPDFYLMANLQPGFSNFGNSYNLPDGIEYGTDEARNYLAGFYCEWIVDELETYFI
ncbi:hypothetical protein M0811_02412 [Anaeramoeba ignava]|uniref:TLDc domain-containing protein n=1 Tax=Anaeramoeba ignava TaxID=1746090 RepID=A0A9Q0L9X3_ANAIG|nr:hypothetical protein M0811_02412 [Anaeramoeba ignava]